MSLHPPNGSRQAFTEFDFTLPTILSGPHRPFPKELGRTEPLADVRDWVDKTFEHGNPESALRRFLRGEFTGGSPPYNMPSLHRAHVDKMLRTLDFIEGMACAADAQAGYTALLQKGESPDGSATQVEFPCDHTYYEPPAEPPPNTTQGRRGCSVPGCGLDHCAKGLCRHHYHKQKRAKTPVEPDGKAEPILVGAEEGVE